MRDTANTCVPPKRCARTTPRSWVAFHHTTSIQSNTHTHTHSQAYTKVAKKRYIRKNRSKDSWYAVSGDHIHITPHHADTLKSFIARVRWLFAFKNWRLQLIGVRRRVLHFSWPTELIKPFMGLWWAVVVYPERTLGVALLDWTEVQ